MIVCSKCQETKSFTEFHRHAKKPSGYRSECKACNKAYRSTPEAKARAALRSKDWRQRNPESRRVTRKKAMLKSFYGLTLEEFQIMRDAQQNKCRICGKDGSDEPKGTLAVDHCHATGEIRGLLCLHCNQGLGHFQDDVERMRAAIAYLLNSKA